MNAFIHAREELYSQLYKRFVEKEGPYFGSCEFSRLTEETPHMKAAVLFAKDMGHIKTNRFGHARLTAQGIIYAEQNGYAQGDD